MSVGAMIDAPGTRVTVYRGTELSSADGGRYYGAPWSVVASDVAVNLQAATTEKVDKVFGGDFTVTATGYTRPDGVLEGDRLLVTAGPGLAERYEVKRRHRHRQGNPLSDYDDLGLTSTSETFP